MLSVGPATREVREVMARALRGKPGFDHEYPTIFGARSRGRVVSLSESGDLQSACAILVRDVRCPEGDLRLGLIGSVATDEASRGRGFASQVLVRAEQELADAGCLASLLWAEDESFYASRGYARVGAEEDFLLERAICPHLPYSAAVRAARSSDAAEIHRLYRTHTRRALRSSGETAALLDGPGMRVFVHDGPEGIDAYTCLGRGGDLATVIHEWAGDTEALLACIAATFATMPEVESLFLMAPLEVPGEVGDSLPNRLREAGVPSAPGVLAIGHLLRPDLAEDRLRVACAASQDLCISRNGDQWSLSGPAGGVTATDADVLSWILAPRAEREALDQLEEQTGLRFPGLPLRPFLWGLDSI